MYQTSTERGGFYFIGLLAAGRPGPTEPSARTRSTFKRQTFISEIKLFQHHRTGAELRASELQLDCSDKNEDLEQSLNPECKPSSPEDCRTLNRL